MSNMKIVFNHRYSSPDDYDYAITNFIQTREDWKLVDFLQNGDIPDYDFSDIDLLIVGAPGSGYTSHPEGSTIAELDCHVISFCRHHSRNDLNMASSSGSDNVHSFTVVDADHPVMQTLGWTDGSFEMGASVNTHHISSLSSETNMIMHRGISDNAGLAERWDGDYSRIHFGYHRFDYAGQNAFDLLETIIDQYIPPLISADTERVVESDSAFYNNTSTGRSGDIQEFEVPQSGYYKITAYGAEGGGEYGATGLGAKMAGKFELEEGQKIDILVGQQGLDQRGDHNTSNRGGGGGGTFACFKNASDEEDILIIAGGGGGHGTGDNHGLDASIKTAGVDGENHPDSGGQEGSGGLAGSRSYSGAGGGGFHEDGKNGPNHGDGGQAFLNGGLGGSSRDGDGGFGGGGGNGWYGGPGGGGYSGGGGCNGDGLGGGGGGSYIDAEAEYLEEESEPGFNKGHGCVEIEFLDSPKLITADAERLVSVQEQKEADTERFISKKKANKFQQLRLVSRALRTEFPLIRSLQFALNTKFYDTLRLMHLTKNLVWAPNKNRSLEFTPDFWSKTEKFYHQFAKGDHYVTKAYEGESDYLGLADDYDFAWGPEKLGTPLPEQTFPGDWDKSITRDVFYSAEGYGFNKYDDTLWGVYAKTAGEIFLLQPDENFCELLRHEQMVFAPSGSIHPAITFTARGYYALAVEIVPALQDYPGKDDYTNYEPEIWLLSHPFRGNDIRKIAHGRRPRLCRGHDKKIVVFYMDKYGERIFYRLEAENFEIEHKVGLIYLPERKMEMTNVALFSEPKRSDYHEEIEGYLNEYSGRLIIFYDREDDWQPHRYALSGEAFNYPLSILPLETISLEPGLKTEWEDIRRSIEINSYNKNTHQPATGKVIVKAQRDQPKIEKHFDQEGRASFKILPYSTVYEINMEDPEFGQENSWGLLLDPAEDCENFSLPFLIGENERIEFLEVQPEFGVEWEEKLFSVLFTLLDVEGEPLPETSLTLAKLNDQEALVGTTDADGQLLLEDIIPYQDDVYEIIFGEKQLDNWGIMVGEEYQQDLAYMEVVLRRLDDMEENLSVDSELTSVEWASLEREVNFTIYDAEGNLASGAEVTVHEQRNQGTKTFITDSEGRNTVTLISYKTVYDVSIVYEGEFEESWGILVQEEEANKIDVELVLNGVRSSPEEVCEPEPQLSGVIWLEV